jgi:hypothetical protein
MKYIQQYYLSTQRISTSVAIDLVPIRDTPIYSRYAHTTDDHTVHETTQKTCYAYVYSHVKQQDQPWSEFVAGLRTHDVT